MSKNAKMIICRILCMLMASLLILTACEGGAGTSSGEPRSSDPADKPEYNYGEFVNDTEQDKDLLETDSISEKEAKVIQGEWDRVRDVVGKYEKKHGKKITMKNRDDYFSGLWRYLYQKEMDGITYIELEESGIRIGLQSGGEYVYQPEIKGYDSAGNQMEIATYQPGLLSQNAGTPSMKYPDEAARIIADEFAMYRFDSSDSPNDRDYNGSEVTPEAVLDFGRNNIIFWHGHGVYNRAYGCCLALSMKPTTDNIRKYGKQINERTLLLSNNYFLITPEFIRTYFSDYSLNNCIFYLGACSSARDDSLVEALLEKGAMAVFANSGEITTEYNLSMMKSVAEGLVQKSGGHYQTLDQALEYAKSIHGPSDKNGAEVRLYYGNGYGSISLDWYEDHKVASRDVALVLDCSGSMEGRPLEQTKEAAGKFVDTVMEKDSRVALIPYDSTVLPGCGLTHEADRLKDSIEQLETGGSTNTYDAMERAREVLSESAAEKKIIVLMTDGLPNAGNTLNGSYEDALVEHANQLKDEGYYIYTLGFFANMEGEDLSVPQKMLGDMASPGYHYEVQSEDDLVFFFDDIASQIGGRKYVYIRIACPVNVTVEHGGEQLSSDPENETTRTSFGSLSYEEGEEAEPVKILRLDMEKDYDVSIQGYDEGEMTYTVSYPNSSGEYTDVREFPGIPVSDNMQARSSTENTGASYLEVDQNGDGSYETKYKTESNGAMEEVEDRTVLYIVIAVVALIVIILVVVIILVIRKKGPSRRDIPAPPPPSSDGAIVVVSGAAKPRQYFIQVGMICEIGRASSCQIQLAHPKVSRLHCKVRLLPNGQYQVIDGSSNGTVYNNQMLERGKVYTLPKGAFLAVGSSENVLRLQ